MSTYFRPRRAAELIHQNKVLNTWKEYKKPNLLSSWTTPPSLTNGTTNSNPMSWQPIPSSAAVKSVRNGNTSPKKTLEKPFYGVRPTLNVTFNCNSLTPDKSIVNKPLNYPHYLNETGAERSLNSMRSPFMPAAFMRDNYGWDIEAREWGLNLTQPKPTQWIFLWAVQTLMTNSVLYTSHIIVFRITHQDEISINKYHINQAI